MLVLVMVMMLVLMLVMMGRVEVYNKKAAAVLRQLFLLL